VVAAARHAVNLRPALRLGAAIDVPVILMCSRAARAEAATNMATGSDARCVVVDLSTLPPIDLPDLETSRFRQAQVGSHGDLSQKRNLGLLLGRLAGWRTTLFLDDDISALKPERVLRATAALNQFAAVGMPAKQYPDNSVVCHARRLTGGRQGVFVSGSALAVDVARVHSFFPDIYNEDWLFLAAHLDQREVAYYGSVRQDAYEPFRYPYRAGAQEFGDVLAEGLIGYLHRRPLQPLPALDYWTAFLECRTAFLARIQERCRRLVRRHVDAEKALTALGSAEQALAQISAASLVAYLEAWDRDCETWREFLMTLPRRIGTRAAFQHLSLPSVMVTKRGRDAARSVS
jgi:hypothetical protein